MEPQDEIWNSLPRKQFEDMVKEEIDLVLKLRRASTRKRHGSFPTVDRFRRIYTWAVEQVKARWVKQNIWKEEWNLENKPGPTDRWPHEGPLPDGLTREQLQDRDTPLVKGDRVISTREKSRILYEHDASRPINQFFAQIRLEQKVIYLEQRRLSSEPGHSYYPQSAYARVRKRWIARHIWDPNWRRFPGDTWRHENSVPDPVAEFYRAIRTRLYEQLSS
ncbi:hypothetical protein K445DRAFT_25777 [Daldinia sp. EC12]|nr:hypothetical protein K445DRAFT_25777 [Daldinia sp. EC12]